MQNSRGFTLVELSIVLVIIGVVAGGILIAMSMIETARITRTISMINQFDTGVNNFMTKYKYLPGDAPGFGGDGDGLIERSSYSTGFGGDNGIDWFECELANFWAETYPEQYVTTACPGRTNVVIKGANKNVPRSPIGATNSFFLASALGLGVDSAYADPANLQNYYAIMPPSQLNSVFMPTSEAGSALKATQGLALDTKMDDGKADSGNIIEGTISSGPGITGGIVSAPNPECSTGPVYMVDNKEYSCTPLIRIGGITGSPQ